MQKTQIFYKTLDNFLQVNVHIKTTNTKILIDLMGECLIVEQRKGKHMNTRSFTPKSLERVKYWFITCSPHLFVFLFNTIDINRYCDHFNTFSVSNLF